MTHRIQWIMIILIHSVLISFGAFAAEDPVEGENFIWIDLGKENEGVL